MPQSNGGTVRRLVALAGRADDKITVNDSDSDAGNYPYQVIIEYNNRSYMSDPEIISKG